MKRISILGSTGSIGRNTLEVIDSFPSDFVVTGLAAGSNYDLFCRQIERYQPEIVSFQRREDSERFSRIEMDYIPIILYGVEGAKAVAAYERADLVVSAITGINGLLPTLEAIKKGKTIALANKESMVTAGPIIHRMIKENGAGIIPVDSEHSGIFQCLAGNKKDSVKKVILTASGGPFLETPIQDIQNKTVEEALKHPRWKMGKKVSIDSATLMNKGLELIEARWLFDLDPQFLDILIHPQSIVHSIVEMQDGSVLAQLSPTDMKFPIQFALTYPVRRQTALPSLDLGEIGKLEFIPVDEKRFPMIRVARIALEEEGSLPIALNAANEVAVEAFIKNEIRFDEIYLTVAAVVEKHRKSPVEDVDDIFEVDRESRIDAREIIEQRK